jgi:hypothetical protein
MTSKTIERVAKAIRDCTGELCDMTLGGTCTTCGAIHKDPRLGDRYEEYCESKKQAQAAVDALGVLILPADAGPEEGDLFVTEEPTKRNFCHGIPDIVRFDASYHTVHYDDENAMFVLTGGGTWLDILRILERSGKPVIQEEK